MSGNEIETFQKISDFIDSFDSTSLGSIIILAILVCVVLVQYSSQFIAPRLKNYL